jgi:hypothetical protein
MAWVVFQRLTRHGTAASAPVTFGVTPITFGAEIAVNTATNRYVIGWSVGGGSRTLQFDASGNMIGAPALLSTRLGTPTGLSFAYNPASNTILAVSEDSGGTTEVAAVELDGTGLPLGTATLATDGGAGLTGSFVPRTTARTDAKHWNISYARNFTSASNQIIGTASGGAPPPPAPPAAPTKSNITVYRPSEGTWYSLSADSGWTSQAPAVRWGLRGDLPLQADFDGDRRRDLVAYRPSTGEWDVLLSSTNFSSAAAIRYQWGAPGDVPMPADYTGDGRTDLAVWRRASGAWFIYDLAKQQFSSYQWGVSTDIPLNGDFDRDGKADIAVYRPSNGYWYVVFSSNLSAAAYQWGAATDVPVPGDYNGDGRTDLAVYRPSSGIWYMVDLATGTYSAYQWGNSSYTPAPKDYDGDGRTDLAIWNPSTGTWYIYFIGAKTYGGYTLGAPADLPVR